MAFLEIDNVVKAFHARSVLNGVSLNIEEGDLVALIGPSGCGKSTLLRCINGLETMDSGRIQMGPLSLLPAQTTSQPDFIRRAQSLRHQIGMVFQSFNLFPHLSVIENIMLAPTVVQKINKSEAERDAVRLLAKVGLGEHHHHFPTELSGGQQQRAAIARALALKPKILLYDEPTSALDPTLVDEVFRVMKQLDQDGMTQIVVTHEIRFAKDWADKVVYLEQGQIVEMGPPETLFSQPRDPRLRSFLKHFLA